MTEVKAKGQGQLHSASLPVSLNPQQTAVLEAAAAVFRAAHAAKAAEASMSQAAAPTSTGEETGARMPVRAEALFMSAACSCDEP